MELLSPAGDMRRLKAAVSSGADAVYLGGPYFGARQSAQNFTIDEMKEAIRCCRLYGVDVHVAVNTLIKEKELPKLEEYLYTLNEIGADALIIQDMGAAALARKIIPDMPLHASTQMTVTSAKGAQYLADAGFSRVVLARELTLKEIESICRSVPIQTEVFVHGAICMCYSGQCLMSSVIGGRSGNRGRCAQPCRLPYEIVKDGSALKKGYLLSPKDMALIERLDELKAVGVDSLKIEGRLKRPEYVSAVTGIYRKYLDNPGEVSDSDYEELLNAFSRSGFTDGYLTGRLGADMMSAENPSNEKENKFTAEALSRDKGEITKKIPVNIVASFVKGETAEVTFYDDDGNCAFINGEIVCTEAAGKPLDSERGETQLKKLGATPFEARRTDVFTDEGITLPISEINELRRKAAAELERMRVSRTEKRAQRDVRTAAIKKRAQREVSLVCRVRTREQLEAARDEGIKDIYAPEALAYEYGAITAAEPIFDGKKARTDGVLAASPAAMSENKGKKLYGDFRLNVFNSLTVREYGGLKTIGVSPELNLKEIQQLAQNTDASLEIMVYGRIGLMLMKNCPLRAAGFCQRHKDKYRLRDRKRREFPLICHEGCICEILNSAPMFTADRLTEIVMSGADRLRLSFTTESGSETRKIIELYKRALSGEKTENPFGENEFTRGHFFRGVD